MTDPIGPPCDWFFVFDVESVGLHGEGFSVGYVLIDEGGRRLLEGFEACPHAIATGAPDDRAWVEANVIPVSPEPTRTCPAAVRASFRSAWGATVALAKESGAVVYMAAEVPWPVEANFLSAIYDDFSGPYPVIDIASVMLAKGMDPMATYDRMADEPAHNPLGDARQSSRLLMMALNGS